MPDIRTFFAFDPSLEVREQAASLLSELKRCDADVKWESAAKMHVTMKFLGGVPEDTLNDVIRTAESALAAHASCMPVFETIGAFPSLRHPNVVWIGCRDTGGALAGIKGSLDRALKPLGFPVGERAFHPHLTLGRVKSPRGLNYLISILEKCTFEPQRTPVSEILVMKSLLRPAGSEYSVLQRIRLQSP
jgi:RNA 2',3'-cyclic 3'-phosphodiesterase